MHSFCGSPKKPHGHPCVAFLPIRLSARKPSNPVYPKEIKSLGDHIRKARLDRRLLQQDVATLLGVDETSVWQWERNRTDPQVHFIPAICGFLGYAPWEPPEGFAAWLRQARRGSGLSRRNLAARIGVDPTTVDRWERGQGSPTAESRRRVLRWRPRQDREESGRRPWRCRPWRSTS